MYSGNSYRSLTYKYMENSLQVAICFFKKQLLKIHMSNFMPLNADFYSQVAKISLAYLKRAREVAIVRRISLLNYGVLSVAKYLPG